MVYVGGTRDKHHCYTCGLTLKDFVVGDTLLGEHIYHVYNKGMACRYIERKYSKGEILYILGKERYRRGQMAFPSLIDKAEFGYSSVEGLYRCILCSATIFQSASLRVMKQAVREVLWKYRRQYAGMLSNQKSVEVHMVTKVAREMCSDGIINWGRIVSLVAFGEVLCRALKTTLGRHCAHEVGGGFIELFDRPSGRNFLLIQGVLIIVLLGLSLFTFLPCTTMK
uniref:Bcl-2 Bcl-2 homology region 1-3 domain-containing protein n=1 Tax=Oreochromis niloticus TaxID=8128 RepID=A0A669CUF8_ORENI